MNRIPFSRHPDRQLSQNHTAPPPPPPPPSTHPSLFAPPTVQPPLQMPFSDPFHTTRDPFMGQNWREHAGAGGGARAWPSLPVSGAGAPHPHHRQLSPPQHYPLSLAPQLPPTPAPGNGLGAMPPPPYDAPPPRRSPGAAGSPPLYARGPIEPPPTPSYPARHMPPPSPPQLLPSSIQMGSAPRGPPNASPFAGVRDLASHRPTMSLSSILGGDEERKPASSPQSAVAAPIATPKSMQPPSPGRVRSASMREGQSRMYREASPPRRGNFGAPPHRATAEPRRDDIFASSPVRPGQSYSFRAFQPPQPEHPHGTYEYSVPGRPSSQPIDQSGQRRMEERGNREPLSDHRIPMFRAFEDPSGPPKHDAPVHYDRVPFQNGLTSHTPERPVFGSPRANHDIRASSTQSFQPGGFHLPPRDDAAPFFRPAYQPTSHPATEMARESIEGRAPDMRRQLSRSSPPPSDLARYDRGRNGYSDRPMTFEEHQKMEAVHRDQLRKESEGSVHRAILNISPELNRKGRNSPLPQAVQGAQSRHIGPGGDNPGIKMEFGRMFSGLGSGVGSATPNAGQSMNGATTPSRMSPARLLESGDLVRTAVAEIDDGRNGTKASTKGTRKGGRRSRDDMEPTEIDERDTPDLQRGSKRTKNSHHHHHHVHPHHHHHHHHHDHEPIDATPGPFSMLRFPSNPPNPTPHHHHHHHHAHPVHHHHHTPRPASAPRKLLTTVLSQKVLDECAGKPRDHLGSQLYTTDITEPALADMPHDAKIKFSSNMKPIPVHDGRENCTFTVRVPRFFLTSNMAGANSNHNLEEICKRRQVWGTDIYTDDSDVVAAAIHSGWLHGDFGGLNDDLDELDILDAEQDGGPDEVSLTMRLDERPPKPAKIPEGYDAHITLLILPPLESYAATLQNHIWSREWKKIHDGMSYMIHRVDFVEEGRASRYAERGAAARKKRLALEEAQRREAAAGLLLFANGSTAAGTVRVGA